MSRKRRRTPPSFQFYPGDFVTGTITMSLAEVGAYTRLLCHQWESGGVAADNLIALARAMCADREEAAALWTRISHKFSRSKKDGLYRNTRMEIERRKKAAFSKLQSQKGKLGGRGKSRGLTEALPEQKPGQSLPIPPSGSTDPSPNPSHGRGRRRLPKVVRMQIPNDAELAKQQEAVEQSIAAARARAAGKGVA